MQCRRSLALLLVASGPALAQTPPVLRIETAISTGISAPVWLGAPRGDNRLFIVEQGGNIRIARNNVVSSTPFLTIPVSSGGERGLLGMAFDPNFTANGHVYVNYTAPSGSPFGLGSSVVARYTVDPSNPDRALPASATTIITYTQPFSNHNGGWLGFSPRDGYLYVPTGDGGSGNDPSGNAQSVNSPLGKILRLDVRTDAFPSDANRFFTIPSDNPFLTDGNANNDTFWATGLRNPWRNDFDDNGDLYMNDVGQGAREEVNYQPATSTGGENYGWRPREGKIQTPGSVGGLRPTGNIDPVVDYPRSVGGSTTGGMVYRGEFLAPLINGQYFYADYISGYVASFDTAQVQSLPRDANGKLVGFDLSSFSPTVINRSAQLGSGAGNGFGIVAFGEDGNREMYIANASQNRIYRVTATRLIADANFDNIVDLNDFFALQANYGLSNRSINQGDFIGNDRFVGRDDLDALIRNFGMTQLGIDTSVPGFDVVQAFAATVPEPATLGAICCVALVALRRRKR